MLPAFVCTEAVGYATTKTTFDDLQDVGGWPSRQDVDKVLKVSIWSADDFSAPTAIEIKYKTVSDPDTPISKSHGVKNAAAEAYAVADNEHFVGMFGAVEKGSHGKLKRVGFLVYNKDSGNLTTIGPFPSKQTQGGNEQGFCSLGLLKGFSGTTSATGYLDTLAVYKAQSGGAGSIGISDTTN